MVRLRRGKKLTGDEEELFSGAVWTGARALEKGLVDGLGEVRGVMRKRYGEDVRFRRYGPKRSFSRGFSAAPIFAVPLAKRRHSPML